jgi:hypothetical protein
MPKRGIPAESAKVRDAGQAERGVEGWPALAGRGLARDLADAQHRLDPSTPRSAWPASLTWRSFRCPSAASQRRVPRQPSSVSAASRARSRCSRMRRAAPRRRRAAQACGGSASSDTVVLNIRSYADVTASHLVFDDEPEGLDGPPELAKQNGASRDGRPSRAAVSRAILLTRNIASTKHASVWSRRPARACRAPAGLCRPPPSRGGPPHPGASRAGPVSPAYETMLPWTDTR